VASVVGSVHLAGVGTGSVYLSNVGAFSRLSRLFGISNMAAGARYIYDISTIYMHCEILYCKNTFYKLTLYVLLY
jgi:hypothetical protein